MTAATTTKAPKIFEAISAIQAEVGKVEKAGTMKFGSTEYKFVKNDDILTAVTKQLQDNNVITKPRIVSRVVEARDIGPNRTLPMISVELEVTYISALDGSEFAITVWGEGAGNDDKGLRKAVTQAQKIANLLTFNIATGEPDPDEFYGNSNPPASGMGTAPSPTRTDAAIGKAKAKAAPVADVTRLQAQVKAAAGNFGWTGAEINAFGEPLVGKDFYNDAAKLQTVYDALIAKAQEAQTE